MRRLVSKLLPASLRLLAAISLPTLATAAPFAVGGIQIAVPARFEGPLSSPYGPRAELHAFNYEGVALKDSAVLQIINVSTSDPSLAEGAPSREELATRVLNKLLDGVRSRRSGFRQSQISSANLAKSPGKAVEWTALLDGMQTNGYLRCVVVNDRAICLHAMSSGSVPNAASRSAVVAIKSIVSP